MSAKTKDEAIRQLHQMRANGAADQELTMKDVLAEEKGLLLVRQLHLLPFGSVYIDCCHYEIWSGRDKWEAGLRGDSNGHIYCESHATMNEEYMLKLFEQKIRAC